MTHRIDDRPERRLAGAASGLLAGAAGVASAEAVTALLDGVTSPLFAVANRAVDATPRPVKEWAIETFGSADKAVLIGGVIATVALLAVAAGVVGVGRPRVATGAFLALSAVATLAALTDRAATAGAVLRLLPAITLAVVAVGSLLVLLRPLRRPAGSRPGIRTADPGIRLEESRDDGKTRVHVGEAALPGAVAGDELPPPSTVARSCGRPWPSVWWQPRAAWSAGRTAARPPRWPARGSGSRLPTSRRRRCRRARPWRCPASRRT